MRLTPIKVPAADIGAFRVAGAWRVAVGDERFAGVSGLAIGHAGLLALTDSGAVVDLPRPGSRPVARIRELPVGPGWPTFKRYRDSEALAWDERRRGWWVTFENRHSLWFYNRDFDRGRLVVALDRPDWPMNKGVEGMVLVRGDPLMLPESARLVLTPAERPGSVRLRGAAGQIADAVRLADGRILVVQRGISLTGISNRLGWLVRDESGYRLRQIGELPLGPFDNVEGLAAERISEGRTRVWAMTDNDGWRRTLLVALDLTAGSPPQR